MNTYKDFCKSLDNKDLPSCLMRDLKVSLSLLLVISAGTHRSILLCMGEHHTCMLDIKYNVLTYMSYSL